MAPFSFSFASLQKTRFEGLLLTGCWTKRAYVIMLNQKEVPSRVDTCIIFLSVFIVLKMLQSFYVSYVN